jgi:hypothetical protein
MIFSDSGIEHEEMLKCYMWNTDPIFLVNLMCDAMNLGRLTEHYFIWQSLSLLRNKSVNCLAIWFFKMQTAVTE